MDGRRHINVGNIDYVKNLEIKTTPNRSVMIEDEDTDFALLGSYPPGTVAFTAGWKKVWQKATSGEWVEV